MIGERDYSQMTPQELNSEFQKCCSLFPRFEFVLPKESLSVEAIKQLNPEAGEELLAHLLVAGMTESEEKRSAGELKTIVMSRIDNLASYSKTTKAFWPVITDHLSGLFDMGVLDSPDYGDWLLPILLDEGKPQGGGLFEINSAESIERKCFRIIKRQREETSNIVRELLQERSLEEGVTLAQLGLNENGEIIDDRFQQWEAAVIERFGDEP